MELHWFVYNLKKKKKLQQAEDKWSNEEKEEFDKALLEEDKGKTDKEGKSEGMNFEDCYQDEITEERVWYFLVWCLCNLGI